MRENKEELQELEKFDFDKKGSKKWKSALVLLLLFVAVFVGYKVLAPNDGAFALEYPKEVHQQNNDIRGCGAEFYGKVKVVLNDGSPAFVDADKDGCFVYNADLKEGLNKIEFFFADSKNKKPTIAFVNYIVSSDGPVLEILEPSSNIEIKIADGKKQEEIIVKGRTESGATVKVNDDSIDVSSDGSFETKVSVGFGENKIIVTAESDGKVSEKEIVVKAVEQSGSDKNENGSNQKNDNTESQGSGNNAQSGNSSSQQSSSDNPSSSGSSGSDSSGSFQQQPITIYPSKVIISYIMYSPDAVASGVGEYIELKNTGDENKDITGWNITDSDGNSFIFPGYILYPGATVRVTTNSGRFLFSSSSSVWDRVGEPGYLRDSTGRLVDAYSY